jgi:hypothetical protein
MSTTTAPSPVPHLDAAPVLSPVISEQYAATARTWLLTGVWGLLFMYFSYTPLFFSDIWGHVNYGLWMLDHRALPLEDPFTPLAEGVSVVCTAWGGQVLFALAARYGGDGWVSNLFAITSLLTMAFLVRAFYHRTASLLAAHAGLLLVALLIVGRHAIVRPEIFGGLSFAILLWLVSRSEPYSVLRRISPANASDPSNASKTPWSLWLGVPALFVVWANLHGSWVVGIALLGACFVGRAGEVVWTRGWADLWQDRWTLRWLLLTELAAVAVLINPYGIELYLNVLTFGSNPNLRDILEWYQLKLLDLEGLTLMVATVITLALWRHSPRPIHPTEVLLLAVFTWSVAGSIRMVNWLAPLYAWAMVPHLAWLVDRLWSRSAQLRDWNERLEFRSFRLTAACLLTVWVAFAFSPASDFLLAARPRPADKLYSKGTPLGAIAYLNEHVPASGMTLTPQWWGDFAIYKGPPALRVVMNTNAVHVAPRKVWQDYLTMANLRTGWERTLDRYAVSTVVIHKEKQAYLISGLKRQAAWKRLYEDDTSLIYGRKSVWNDTPAAKPYRSPRTTQREVADVR